ncbi:MAG: excinuclease ABC subunit UvrC, partial [Clostridia bacterium]|nr:excinuclease ABC subunit UvrC [Clostridia bacterium]
MTDERLKRLREKSMKLPMLPGVYIMHAKSGEIIYVGKAKKLKNRVSQYFGAGNQHSDKVRRMVSNVEDFEYIICDSEFEALVLECSLVKQHNPKYNILLKDDKGYHYIKVTKGDYPTILASFDTDDKNAEYIGPYISGFVVNQTIDEVRKIFRLPQCSKTFPDCVNKKGRPCLNFHIKNCSAPCCGKISAADYLESVKAAVEFLKGGVSQSVTVLREEMEKAAENLQFEKAARLRDRITAIEKINDRQKIYSSIYKRQDIIAVASADTAACFEVFVFSDGKLTDREEFIIDAQDDLASARAEFLQRYYTMRDNIPPRVAVDGDIEDKELLEKWLSDKRGTNVTIAVPERGKQEQLVTMCRNNASERLAQHLGRHLGQTAGLDELARLLGLPKPPKFIESYDISNTAGEDNVAGMVVFKDGKPYKSSYRKFKIKYTETQDDYDCMYEVIYRRLMHYLEDKIKLENGEDPEKLKFINLPQLIFVDGGKGHVRVGREAVKNAGLNIEVFGLVKDNRHKTKDITSDTEELGCYNNRALFNLVSGMQDETHNQAVRYHHT